MVRGEGRPAQQSSNDAGALLPETSRSIHETEMTGCRA